MNVLKFGGTSVGTPESLRCVKQIVESRLDRCIVVVSALGGVTNCLIDMAQRAANGSAEFESVYNQLRLRHISVIAQVVPATKQTEVMEQVEKLLNELLMVCRAIYLLGELTPRSLALVESYGERMSCLIVTAMLNGAVLHHSLDFIRTRRSFDRSVLDAERTSALIAQEFAAEDAQLIVCPGFIARDEAGKVSNLGRGGSDYTAAILAAELGAELLEIWTDVDGFMTADPRRVAQATVIDTLSFVEAMELCNFGAKVVYPPTIYPVFHANIPIVIKNTFNAEAPGTLISANADERSGVTGVSSITDTCMLTLRGGSEAQVERMINSLTRNGVEIMIAAGNSCAIYSRASARALEILNTKFATEIAAGELALEVVTDLCVIAMVAAGRMPDNAAAEIATVLNLSGIPVVYAPRPASASTVACMVPAAYHDSAIQQVHHAFLAK